MIRKKIRLWLKRNRYIISAMLITIVFFKLIHQVMDVHHSSKHKKCYKLLMNEFTHKATKYIYFDNDKRPETLNATELRRWIIRENAKEIVLNTDLYGPLTPDTIIFVVQVHEYSCNINYLLASLSEVEGIQDTLIIFSHSYVDHRINRLLHSIDFCRTLQLFYPYSVQAYPDEFPGLDKNDCPTNLDMKTAVKLNCTGAMTPDVHGRYRDPKNAERKHHWWWTINKVFEDLLCTTRHKGIIVFIDNYFYIYRNIIYMTKFMKKIAETLPQCDFLSLAPGTLGQLNKNVYELEFTTWNPKYHSNILVIDFFTWNNIKPHYDIFCRVDDFSWSRSLFDISINRKDGKVFKVLSATAARALEPSCSVEDVMNCHKIENIVEIINFQNINKDNLFSSYFEVIHEIDLYEDEFISADYVEMNGGWSDQRDKQLCRNLAIYKAEQYFVTGAKKLYLETYYY